jgi:ParB family chromosome partitioning protein
VTRKKRLGRGLEALLNSTGEPVQGNVPLNGNIAVAERPSATNVGEYNHGDLDTQASPNGSGNRAEKSVPREGDIVHLSVYEIEDNPFQPRRVFSEPEIASLAESLKEHDILQPILVRIVDGRYQLISGERRLRAAIKANWQSIPARLRTADDRLVSELAIVENLQRKDLNPIEKALSFRRYIDEHACRQDDLAARLKIDRSTIANLMRLLELPGSIQEALGEGTLSAGHARALLPLGDEQIQIEFADQIQREGLSVRAVEAAVGELIASEDTLSAGGAASLARKRKTVDKQIEALQQELKTALGTKVKIKYGMRQNGQISIHFSNPQEFERLRSVLTGRDSA